MRKIFEPLVRDIPCITYQEKKEIINALSKERKPSFVDSLRDSLVELDSFLVKSFFQKKGLRTDVSDVRDRIKTILDNVCS